MLKPTKTKPEYPKGRALFEPMDHYTRRLLAEIEEQREEDRRQEEGR